ncbi:MAG: hypothetical protein OXE98_01725, partial [Hyphomicrobiales bacterium]|nr:hypothetical protein [Hyphomicrobiales bacterium]
GAHEFTLTVVDDDDVRTRNTIGFSTDKLTIAENVGTDTSLMLQLSNAEGAPYTGSTPADLSLEYTSTGTNDNDFSIRLNDTGQGTTLDASGTVQIAAGQSYTNGQIPITITVTNDSILEDLEEFVYTIRPDSSSLFPTSTWNVDPLASSFTLAIQASDNSVEFANSGGFVLVGRSRTVTLNIANPIAAGETVTVDIGFAGANEGTDFSVTNGTATYSSGTLTLPTGANTATFALQTVDNLAAGTQKTLTLTLSNLAGPDNWGALGSQDTHALEIIKP